MAYTLNILLIDNHATHLLTLEKALEPLGHNLRTARSGDEALRLLQEEDFALILLDLHLGLGVAQRIRSQAGSCHTPILFLTAYESDGFALAQTSHLGTVDYLVKTAEPEVLRAKVTGFIDRFHHNRLHPPHAAPCHLPGKYRRVLVVEDNLDAAKTLCLFLQLIGHEVQVAYTGPEAVEEAQCWHPDVVLCDIGLPGLDGYGVAHALRRHPTTAHVRLLALTGYGSDEDRRRSKEAGFEAHLVKPADPAEIAKVLVAC